MSEIFAQLDFEEREEYKPNECYFCIAQHDQGSNTVVIVPKDFWDTEGFLADWEFEVLGTDLFTLAESYFEFDGEMPEEEAYKKCVEWGLEFNAELKEFVEQD